MQTFLPYPDFKKSAACLDYKRLGKQRVEAYQILGILLNISPKAGWRNHPAVLMWKGYEVALCQYTMIMINEWKKRGYKDTLESKIWSLFCSCKSTQLIVPSWLGNRNFHLSHQSNLVRKQPEYYRKYFHVRSDLPYEWPVRIKDIRSQ